MSDGAIHVVIHGRVQGVGFRAWMSERANELGLQGWVRNRNEGSLEALLRGDEDALEELLGECEYGPPEAEVDDIAIQESMSDDIDDGFYTRSTV